MRHLYMMGISLLFSSLSVLGQYPSSCSSVGSRANSNGQATNCPNVSGTAMASNFNSTSYATVPGTGKTGNLQLVYAGANAGLLPFAITRTWATSAGVTNLTTVAFGPASPVVVSGGTTQVNYCFYTANLATIGTLSFEFTNPQTGVIAGICSFDATCNSNCTVVANPGALPVLLSAFKVTAGQGRSALLDWTTAMEQNNKGYEIERSIDGGVFDSIAFVPTSNPGGNSAAPGRYSYTDLNVPDGQSIGYRLKQVDLDGKSTYSETQLTQLKTTGGPGIYSDGKTITVTFRSAPQSILVHDTEGRTIRQYHPSATRQFHISDLPGGHLYYISVQEADATRPTVKSVFLGGQ
ncbi:MAG TPA: hypothetical protein VI233_09140 [Puia sp.]